MATYLSDERAAHELQGADTVVVVGVHGSVLVRGDRGQQDARLPPPCTLASSHLDMSVKKVSIRPDGRAGRREHEMRSTNGASAGVDS